MKLSSSILLAFSSTAAAFAPVNNKASHNILNAQAASTIPSKPIFDPLGLYPENSPERQSGLIIPLESTFKESKEIIDPLNLYKDPSQLSTVEMSPSLPFLPNPSILNGLPGNRGFDPFNLASTPESLQWQRNAEIKHARLAMLASLGWVGAELLHVPLATMWNLPVMLASNDRVPSILNDGLVHADFPIFWAAAIAAGAGLEICEVIEDYYGCKLVPGDWGFDPLNLGGEKNDKRQFFMQEAELFNGRLGMLAITGFAFQEWFMNSSVVNQVPSLFKPVQALLEHLFSG